MTETEALAALNALHSPDPDGWKPGTSTDYMTCKGCDVLTLGGGCRRLWKDCPTRAILARVGSGAVPPDGWFPFGSHVDFDGPLEFSPELDEGGLPFWERHVGSGAVPPHTIDRDALVQILDEECVWDVGEGGFERAPGARVADRILALVRPVEGIVLEANEHGKVHVENGWRIRRTYVVGEPGELVERLGAAS